jgi:hypothetical protein
LSSWNKGNQVVPLVQVVIVLIVVGVLLWLINRYIPMAASIKSILNAVVVIAVVVWLLKLFGLWSYITNIHIGR